MKVLLIDDHPLILAALQSVIHGLGDDVTVVGVGSEREARAALKQDPDHDLVLLDLHLGDSDGFDLLADLRKLYPALPIVVVSASDRASDVIRAIDAGAMGFVPKRSANDTLFQALRLVMNGGIYVPPMALGLSAEPEPEPAVESDLDEITHNASAAPHQQPAPSFESLGLSPRQSVVLSHLLKGLPNKLIAREMGVSIETVKDHVAAVLRALKVSSRTQAVLAIGQMTQASGQPWRSSK